MPRETITPEQRAAEAERLSAFFKSAQLREPGLTQESLANEMDLTQGNIHQWLKGLSPIPIKRLFWLARRLGFDPRNVRDNLEFSPDLVATERERITINQYLMDPDFRRIVEAVAESSGIYSREGELQSRAGSSQSQGQGNAK